MASPVQLSNLPLATSALPGDYCLLRSGLTDYKITVLNLIQLVVGNLPSLTPDQVINSDLMFVSRGGQNYQVNMYQIGFQASTQMWFFSSQPPLGWTIIPNTGDMLLGVSDNTTMYNAVSPGGTIGAGTWQQNDAFLTAAQLAPHDHSIPTGTSVGVSNSNCALGGIPASTNIRTNNNSGSGAGHNHGAIWRPKACVGCLGIKTS